MGNSVLAITNSVPYLKTSGLSQPGMWHTPVIPALRKPRQEDLKFEASLNYVITSCLKRKLKKIQSLIALLFYLYPTDCSLAKICLFPGRTLGRTFCVSLLCIAHYLLFLCSTINGSLTISLKISYLSLKDNYIPILYK
jgi:hypothetical protein